MQPHLDTATWMETTPDPIVADAKLAALAVRVGMASNALNAQMQAGVNARKHRYSAAKTRDVIWAFVNSAAFTREAAELARKEMPRLRPLVERAPGVSPDLVERMKRLCDGQHPAAPILKHARNRIGFHWDADVVEPSVKAYGSNQKIVWLESDSSGRPVHRLAVDVLVHAMFPGASDGADVAATKTTINEAMNHIDDAMRLIIEFFTAATYGYMATIAASQRRAARPQKGGRR